MEMAKEIRSGDKKRVKTGVKTPINRRPGWVPGGSVVCWRMLAFLGAGDARMDGPPPGLVVLSVAARAPGRWSVGDGWAAAICGGNSVVFNQQLTIFLVVAMVWRLPVFFLCSYCLFWRALPGR